ncbi:MAG TPA: hypothetical protein VK589_16965, partial [Chryseolinea sp.]|nr:hypothetical protein [Chryseolinea sp.]
EPIDSLSYFFPTELTYRDSLVKTGLDTFNLNWYSSQLFPTKEPILFNNYLGHDIYRFTWLRSFHNPVVLTIHKKDDKVWLTVKKLDRHPQFMPTRIITDLIPPKVGEPYDTTKRIDFEKYPIKQPDRHANLAINEMKSLSASEWNEFESMLTKIDYWNMRPTQKSFGLDGAQWIIEAHSLHKYWFVDRWSPEDDYKQAGLYLIKLSGLDEEIY